MLRNMIWRFRRRILLAVSVLAVAAVCVYVGDFERVEQVGKINATSVLLQGYILVDAGHGMPDPGASAADGTQESVINLEIAKPLRDLLVLLGYDVRMTREGDYGIYDDHVTSIRDKKISDMRNRLEQYNKAAVVVSIHQNVFTQTQYSGTQVFYSGGNVAGKPLAGAVQQSVRELLQPKNIREIKKGGSGIYLLHNTTAPAVLVECGFLSNPAECVKLKEAAYQRQMALAIGVGVVTGMQ